MDQMDQKEYGKGYICFHRVLTDSLSDQVKKEFSQEEIEGYSFIPFMSLKEAFSTSTGFVREEPESKLRVSLILTKDIINKMNFEEEVLKLNISDRFKLISHSDAAMKEAKAFLNA